MTPSLAGQSIALLRLFGRVASLVQVVLGKQEVLHECLSNIGRLSVFRKVRHVDLCSQLLSEIAVGVYDGAMTSTASTTSPQPRRQRRTYGSGATTRNGPDSTR